MNASESLLRVVLGTLRGSFPTFLLVFALLAGSQVGGEGATRLLITEFMAGNSSGLADEEGEFSDWIEVHNPGLEPVKLEGWSLTDNAGKPGQWRFPNTNLVAGGHMVVFASGKDRRRPGQPLHTNFKLSLSGEYLGLMEPDGKTVASEYAPVFLPQVNDVSYGLDPGLRPVTLISAESQIQWKVPQNDDEQPSWLLPDFNVGTSGWMTATGGLGYFAGSVGGQVNPEYRKQLAGYWPLDETAGGVAGDFSGNQNQGALSNFTTVGWMPGVQGNALRLRGTSRQFVRVANYPKSTGALSAAGWVWLDSRSALATVMRNGGGTNLGQFQLGLKLGTSELEAVVRTESGLVSVADVAPLATGMWHHVAFVADGNTVRLFRNGVMVGTTNRVSPVASTAFGPLSLGARLNAAGTAQDVTSPGYWNGRFDDMALWNRALGEGEVAELYYTGGGLGTDAAGGKLAFTDVREKLQGVNGSAWVRIPFVVENPLNLVKWRFSVQYEDGYVLWLNGQEVVRRNAPDVLTWDAVATEGRDSESVRETEILKLDPFMGFILPGTNVLALQWLNRSAADPSAWLRCSLEASSTLSTTNELVYFTQPTPGIENVVGTKVLGPILSEAQHLPQQPRDGDSITVTVKALPSFAPVAEVLLKYRVKYSNEVVVAMLDDGKHGDGAAGDGVFGATIPAEVSGPGEMVRYAFTAKDAVGTGSRLPTFLAPADSSEYFGTVIVDPSVVTGLPVMQWFVKSPSAAESDAGTRCSVYYQGEFYDNVYIRIRGGTSRGWPKKSYKVELNPDHEFRIHPGVDTVTEFDMNTTYTDKSYVRAVMHYELQRDAGQPSPETFPLHLRQNGAFYSVTLFTEQPDKAFLRRNGLDDLGSLYKVGPGGNYETEAAFEKKTREFEGTDDLKTLLKSVNSLTGAALERYVFDQVDLPGMVSYMATEAIAQNIDGTDKNHFLYRDTRGSGEWRMLPWDLDLSFGPNALNTDVMVASENFTSHPFIGARPYMLHDGKYNRLMEAVVASQRYRQMLLRRIRTLCEEYLVKPYFQNRMTELELVLAPDVVKDKAKWKTDADFGGGVYTLRQAMDRIRNEYLLPRPIYLMGSTIPGVTNSNPGSQTWAPEIRFGLFEANPATGNQNHEFVQITNRASYPVDLTGMKVRGDVEFEFRPGTVLPPFDVLYLARDVASFRTRPTGPSGGQGLFVSGNYRGQLSAGGGVVRLLTASGRVLDELVIPEASSDLQKYLRVTEIHSSPAPFADPLTSPEDGEFVEVRNVSTNKTLSLSQARFTSGIEFDFGLGSIAELRPGDFAVVVGNRAVFESRYGVGLPVAGQFLGRLDNNGERLRLEETSGEVIQELKVDSGWYPLTGGHGFSLVRKDTRSTELRVDLRGLWRQSGKVHGSPGAEDPAPLSIQPVWVNEVLSATSAGVDSVELYNPGPAVAAIGNWYLTDDFSVPKKYRIPAGRELSVGAYEVSDERGWSAGIIPFKLQADGDEIWLFSADSTGELTGYVNGFKFGAAPNGVSYGRVTNSLGEASLVLQTSASLGAANPDLALPKAILTEVSPEGDGRGAAYVEIWNRDASTLALGGWLLRGEIDFEFPSGITLAPLERLLVVGFAPDKDEAARTAFQLSYPGLSGIQLVGPWSRRLNGLELVLEEPLVAGTTNSTYRMVDQVNRNSSWAGLDLVGPVTWQKKEWLDLAGSNEPGTWQVGTPSPGRAAVNGAGPRIVEGPVSQSVVAFRSIALRVNASGGAKLGYQWYRNGDLIVGATGSVLQWEAIQPDDFGSYRVVVYDESGLVWSEEAVVDVMLPAFITQEPVGKLVRQGSNVTFTVQAIGKPPLSYQWFQNGTILPGETASTLLRAQVGPPNSGNYTVRVTDAVGASLSKGALLTVAELPRILQQPQDYFTVVGGELRIQVEATGVPAIGYRWRRGTSVVAGQTSKALIATNVTATFAGNYVVVITNFAGSVTSQIARVVVDPDADRDGVSDVWEVQNQFSASNAADGSLDTDGDGMSNRDEYVAGTLPRDASSYLELLVAPELEAGAGGQQGLILEWEGVAGRSYEIVVRKAANAGWESWRGIPTLTTNGLVRIRYEVGPGAGTEWFRLKTPWAP